VESGAIGQLGFNELQDKMLDEDDNLVQWPAPQVEETAVESLFGSLRSI
jgi:hypothetical protein